MTHRFTWPYFTLRADGVLINAANGVPLAGAPRFTDAGEAEAWLVANDVRGTIR